MEAGTSLRPGGLGRGFPEERWPGHEPGGEAAVAKGRVQDSASGEGLG